MKVLSRVADRPTVRLVLWIFVPLWFSVTGLVWGGLMMVLS